MLRTLSLRTVLERESIVKIAEEPEFQHTITRGKIKDKYDHYLAVLVFTVEAQEDGRLLLRPASTTLLGIQRYTIKRLYYQGVYVSSKPADLVKETLRAHFRADTETLHRHLEASWGLGVRLHWSKHYANGAGDLDNPPEFLISDPELEELERLFNAPDAPPEAEDEIEN